MLLLDVIYVSPYNKQINRLAIEFVECEKKKRPMPVCLDPSEFLNLMQKRRDSPLISHIYFFAAMYPGVHAPEYAICETRQPP